MIRELDFIPNEADVSNKGQAMPRHRSSLSVHDKWIGSGNYTSGNVVPPSSLPPVKHLDDTGRSILSVSFLPG